MKYSRDQIDADPRAAMIGELTTLYDAAGPLTALTEDELRRMRRRVRRSLMGAHSSRRLFRLSTMVAGILLLLLGSIGYAAVERLGWIKHLWKSEKVSEPAVTEHSPTQARQRKTARKVAASSDLSIALPSIPDPFLLPTRPFDVIVSTPTVEKSLPEASKPIPIRSSETKPGILRKPGQIASPMPFGRGEARPEVHAIAPVETTPIETPTPVSPDPAKPAPHVAEATVPDIEPALSNSEPALVRMAMQRLRKENDPAGALSLLGDLAQRFPKGALIGERSILEVEALLGLKREAEALARLDGMNLSDLPRSGERFVLRGELRAIHRRYAEAAMDFDRALARVSGIPAWHERALWGRAVARLQNGERNAGIADLEDYLEQYPKGRYAAEASRLLHQR